MRQETKFPESDTTRLNIKAAKPVSLAMQIRWPEWSEKLSVRVNGRSQKISGQPGSYVSVSRTWQNGDHVDIQLAMKLHTEPLPGTSNIVAVLYGPVVLAGELGTNGMPNPYAGNQTALVRVSDPAVPALVGDATSILKKIKKTGAPLVFRTKNLGPPNEVTLVPLYRANHERYTVYWNLVSAADAKKSPPHFRPRRNWPGKSSCRTRLSWLAGAAWRAARGVPLTGLVMASTATGPGPRLTTLMTCLPELKPVRSHTTLGPGVRPRLTDPPSHGFWLSI